MTFRKSLYLASPLISSVTLLALLWTAPPTLKVKENTPQFDLVAGTQRRFSAFSPPLPMIDRLDKSLSPLQPLDVNLSTCHYFIYPPTISKTDKNSILMLAQYAMAPIVITEQKDSQITLYDFIHQEDFEHALRTCPPNRLLSASPEGLLLISN